MPTNRLTMTEIRALIANPVLCDPVFRVRNPSPKTRLGPQIHSLAGAATNFLETRLKADEDEQRLNIMHPVYDPFDLHGGPLATS